MASGSFNLTRTGSTSSYITFKCAWSSKSNGSTANTSTVTVVVTATKSSASTADTYGSQTTTVSVGGTSQSASGSFTLKPNSSITLLSKTWTVKHNDDGTKKVTISVNVGGNVIYANGSKTVTLDTIPRYGSIAQSLNARTETTITMNWSSDSTVDYLWYSTNNGSTWTGIDIADGKSGTYTISGLNANTKYNVKTRIRRKDSQLTADSAALAVTTYAYPYCNSAPNFTIGDRLTLGFYNPLNRTITVNIIGADGSQISNDTTTGASISGYNGAVVVDRLLNSIPNDKSGKYSVKVTYNGKANTRSGGTYTVSNSTIPSIAALSYVDVNSITEGITGNNQLIIRNQSKVQFTAAGLAGGTAATVTACSINVNGNVYNLTLDGDTATGGNITIDSASSLDVVFTVTDSRGMTATRALPVTMLDWVLPTAIIECQRQNNFYSETDINVNADYSSIDGKNTIDIKCRYKKISESSYGDYATLQDAETSTLTLDNLYEWNIQVLVADLFGSTTYNLTVPLGMPIIFFDRLLNSTGFNCFPTFEKDVAASGRSLLKSAITASLENAMTDLTESTYTKIPLNLSVAVGDRLTLTDDGGIKIGAGVTAVMVSGRVSYNSLTAGAKHVRVMKNSYTNNNTIAWTYQNLSAAGCVDVTPTLAQVQEGDIIYLWYHTTNSTDTIGGNAYGARTSLTVETL